MSSQMDRHHLSKRIDVKTVLGCTVAKRGGQRNSKLFEHRIENREPRHEFGVSRVAVVDLADGGLIHGRTQINLQDFGMAMMFPSRRCLTRRQANSSRPDQFAVSRTTLNLPRYLRRARQMVDQHRMSDCRLRCLKRPFLDNRRMQGSPPGILTVRNKPIPGADSPPVRLVNSKSVHRGSYGKHWQFF